MRIEPLSIQIGHRRMRRRGVGLATTCRIYRSLDNKLMHGLPSSRTPGLDAEARQQRLPDKMGGGTATRETGTLRGVVSLGFEG